MKRVCTVCKEEKDLSEFYNHPTGKDGKTSRCKKCMNDYQRSRATYVQNHPKKRKYRYKEYTPGTPEYRKNNQLRTVYGITLIKFRELLRRQGYRCAICGMHQDDLSSSLHIDHCHTTKRIRGLLCRECNQGLGKFRDNPEFLKNAIEYLKNEEDAIKKIG